MELEAAIEKLQRELAADKEALRRKEEAIALLVQLARNEGSSASAAVEQGEPLARSPFASRDSALAARPPGDDSPVSQRVAHPRHQTETSRAAVGVTGPQPVASERDTLVQAVREAAAELKGSQFHALDVHQILEDAGTHIPGKHPRQFISGVLDVLVTAGELERTVAGRGRMPSAYRHR